MIDATVRLAFQDPIYVFVKVSPSGFLINDEPVQFLPGRIVKTYLVRKRFEDGKLVCSSNHISSPDSLSCSDCGHPHCRPHLRLCLRDSDTIYVLDLNSSSAKNLLYLEDALEAEGKSLEGLLLRLTVINRGYWGEVSFEIVEE